MCVNCESEFGVIRHPAEVLVETEPGAIDKLLPLYEIPGNGDALFQACPSCNRGGTVKGADTKFTVWGDVLDWLHPYEPPAWDDAERAAVQL